MAFDRTDSTVRNVHKYADYLAWMTAWKVRLQYLTSSDSGCISVAIGKP
jgi:hypothetical protein